MTYKFLTSEYAEHHTHTQKPHRIFTIGGAF